MSGAGASTPPAAADAGAPRRVAAVSVVVCNYNGAAHLPHCLAAVRALAGPVDEVLVVDNASTDGSRELLRREHPDVRVVELATNDGPSAARNAGMRAARQRWVLALDNDAVCRPDALEKLVAAAEAHPGACALQPRSVFAHEPERVHYDGGAFHYVGLFALRNFYRPLAAAEGRGALPVGGFVSVALLVDRDALLAAGGYDPAYFILFEDLDLSYRLRLAGWEVVSVEDALVLHREGTAGISFREGPRYPASRTFLHARNRWRFVAKCYRARTIVVALPGLLLYELASLCFALAAGGGLAWLRGKAAFLGGLGELRAARRAVQATRRVPDRELLVGGPWTVTPAVESSALRRGAQRAIGGLLELWWRLARRLAG